MGSIHHLVGSALGGLVGDEGGFEALGEVEWTALSTGATAGLRLDRDQEKLVQLGGQIGRLLGLHTHLIVSNGLKLKIKEFVDFIHK